MFQSVSPMAATALGSGVSIPPVNTIGAGLNAVSIPPVNTFGAVSIPPVNAGLNAVSISRSAPAYNTRSKTATSSMSVPGSPTGSEGGRKKRRSTNKRKLLVKRVRRRRSMKNKNKGKW